MTLSKSRNTLEQIAPAGFYVALRVGYSFPEEELNGLDPGWIETYTQLGLVMQDPSMRWVYAHTGAVRWSELELPDPAGVIGLARKAGLSWGATVAFCRPEDAGRRSYAMLFRADRNFTQDELDSAYALLRDLHLGAGREAGPALTEAELEAIRLRAGGKLLKQIAAEIGISESAVKARLASACRKTGAKNAIELLSIATTRRMI